MFNRLHVYTVHREPKAEGPEDVKFVREGFSFFAFLFTGIWALFNRLWLEAIVLIVLHGIIFAMQENGVLQPISTSILQLGIQLIAGLQGHDWIRSRYRRKGFTLVDIVTGDNKLRAEQRFFDRLLSGRAAYTG